MDKTLAEIWRELFIKRITEDFIAYADAEFGKPHGENPLCQTLRFASYYKCFLAARGIK